MIAQVIIADDRPRWCIEEDNLMACLIKCKQNKRCSSRYGFECKKLGGNKIPRLR